MILYKKLQKGDVVDFEKGESMYGEALKQQQWTSDQINSPMYRTRLTREGYTEKNIDAELERRRSRVADTEISIEAEGALSNEYGNGLSYIAGVAYDGVSPGYPHYEREDDYDTYDKEWEESVRPQLRLDSNTDMQQSRPIAAHEFSHISKPGKEIDPALYNHLYDTSIDRISHDKYISTPTEVKARVDEVRRMASELGIYDSATEEFTGEHYQQLLDVYKGRRDTDYDRSTYIYDNEDRGVTISEEEAAKKYPYATDRRVMEPIWELDYSLPGEGTQGKDFKQKFMWMMNNIAQNQQPEQGGILYNNGNTA